MSPRDAPSLSVVMPVHNALPYLDEAVESIRAQTRSDFEFVIYDDQSTDGSAERLEEWARRDSRIKLFRGKRNLGPAHSSNEVVRLASGSLIARMDADDISLPERLERESKVLEDHPDVGLVGSLCNLIDPQGRTLRGPELWRLTRKSWLSPFPHGSMMFRRELFDAIGGYRAECEYWEDLDFVIRASEQTAILVLPMALYHHRQSYSSTRLASEQRRVEDALDLRYRSMSRVSQRSNYSELEQCGPAEEGRRVHPRIFVSLGSLQLWSGRRPRVLRRFLTRARLGFDVDTFVSAAWVVWASLSPSTLRASINLVSKIRSNSASNSLDLEKPVEWRPQDKGRDGENAAEKQPA